jgi:hypothetical protein
MNLRPHQSALLAAILVAAVSSLIPFIQVLLLPLGYLNTHLHEMCHALVAIATGGQVEEILVNVNGSGVTPVEGGLMPLIASAGYMGSTVLGAAMISIGSTPNRAKGVLGAIAGLLALSMVLWVRGDTVGVLSGFAWMAVLGLSAVALKGTAALFFCQFIGLEQCLNSFSSVYQLLRISVVGEAQSDASLMQSVTLLPAWFWATAWAAFSLLLIGFTVRSAWTQSPKKPRAG